MFLQLGTTFHLHGIFISNWGLVATIPLPLLLRGQPAKCNLGWAPLQFVCQRNRREQTPFHLNLCGAVSGPECASPFSNRDGHTEQIIAMSRLLHEFLSFLSFGFWSACKQVGTLSGDPSIPLKDSLSAELLGARPAGWRQRFCGMFLSFEWTSRILFLG